MPLGGVTIANETKRLNIIKEATYAAIARRTERSTDTQGAAIRARAARVVMVDDTFRLIFPADITQARCSHRRCERQAKSVRVDLFAVCPLSRSLFRSPRVRRVVLLPLWGRVPSRLIRLATCSLLRGRVVRLATRSMLRSRVMCLPSCLLFRCSHSVGIGQASV